MQVYKLTIALSSQSGVRGKFCCLALQAGMTSFLVGGSGERIGCQNSHFGVSTSKRLEIASSKKWEVDCSVNVECADQNQNVTCGPLDLGSGGLHPGYEGLFGSSHQ